MSTLEPGARLGSYEVLAPLGAGGMGEVYRARDPKLDREVALKVLPAAFGSDADRLARFHREARSLAALNHPGIAAIHGLEDEGGKPFLVLELVEGETLRERLERGAIPVDEALRIALQIAEALEEAHAKGLVHRDLKPANVKLTPEGKVKLLDFGLAKALAGEEGEDPDASASPTLSARATAAGLILGTAAYMSPEQARGKTADRRSDVWAFGVVLYEMLTGRRLFAGETVSDTLASVIKEAPSWDGLPEGLPWQARRVLARCLEKDRKDRLQDIGDARLEVAEALAGGDAPLAGLAAPAAAVGRRAPAWRERAIWGLAILVASAAAWSLRRPEPPARAVARFALTLPAADSFTFIGRHVLALSPDGTRLVYGANEQLYLREMDRIEATQLRGTDTVALNPFFSPDGQWVGFFTGGVLRKVSVTAGAPVTLCEAVAPYGARWEADGTIVFGQGPSILRVGADGGTPETLVTVDAEKGEVAHGPQMLPGGDAVLFTLGTAAGTWDDAQIVVQSLASGERRVLVEGGSDGRYLPSGHLVYALGSTLLAVPFDLERLAVTGGPVPLVEGVARGTPNTGAAHVSTSDSGSLAYVPADSLRLALARHELVRVDREGNATPLTDTLGDWETPRVSPDGRRLAVRRMDENNQQDIWVLELSRGTLTRLTFEEGLRPLWAPDGQTLYFGSARAGQYNLFSKPADGTGTAQQLTTGPFRVPSAITSDGRTLVFRQAGDAALGSSLDLGTLALEGEAEPEMLLATSYDEHTAKLSPDDRWLAYVSNESGRDEVYVTRFPTGGKWQISADGGREPLWSRDGRELFYRNGEKMMAVDISGGPQAAGRPALLFEKPYVLKEGSGATNYDVLPDDQGFVMIRESERTAEAAPPQQIILVLNWLEELKRRVPTD